MEQSEITQIIEKQRKYFESQVTKDYNFRLNALQTLKRAILAYEDRIYDAMYADFRKSKFEVYATEIGLVLSEISYHIKKLKCWMKPQRVRTEIVNFLSCSRIYSEPFGTVLIMSPWNYPFQLLINPLVGAISAGNVAVLKPANYSVNTSRIIKEMLNEYFSEEYISVFLGGREINNALLDECYDYIFFTGSPSLGKIVMERASRNLTPVSLELGGKSPCIVDEDANIKVAAKRIAWGKFLNGGQTCVAPDYLLVHKNVKDKLIKALIETIEDYYGKEPKDSPDFPRIVNEKQFEHLEKFLKEGKILYGGKTDKQELYISPTIIGDVSDADSIMQEEIFGPIFPVMTFENLNEVIQYVNSNPKPLAFYYFGEDKNKQEEVLAKTSSGGGCINDVVAHLANHYMPFGGVGNSGMGGYHGKFSFDAFSHKRSILKKATWLDVPVRYAPYKEKIKLLKILMK